MASFAPAFGRRFVVMADAEEEFDWASPFSRAATSTGAIGALPAATRRLRRAGVTPTYMLDHAVVAAPASAAIVRALAGAADCDIGAQLHPWVTPPDDEELSSRNSFQGNLPEPLERAKIAQLTQAITDATGIRPALFRAGRYGVGPNTARLLIEQGYRLDASTRPLFDYSDEGGPDFRRHPAQPWWAAPDLLEVPLSASFTGRLRRSGRWLYGAAPLRGPLARAGLLSRVAITPEGMPVGDALAAIDAMLDDGARLLSLSFHTPSLEPGHTPYVRDARDLAAFWGWWDRVLERLAARGVTACRPSEILAAARPLPPARAVR